MKRYILIFFCLISLSCASQINGTLPAPFGVTTPLIKFPVYTTAQRDALAPLSTDRVIIHHKDTGIDQLEQWDGDSWEALGGSSGTDENAIHDNEAGEINAITEKVTPVADDILFMESSEDSWQKFKVKIGNLPFLTSADLSNYVTTNTTQTITGSKTIDLGGSGTFTINNNATGATGTRFTRSGVEYLNIQIGSSNVATIKGKTKVWIYAQDGGGPVGSVDLTNAKSTWSAENIDEYGTEDNFVSKAWVLAQGFGGSYSEFAAYSGARADGDLNLELGDRDNDGNGTIYRLNDANNSHEFEGDIQQFSNGLSYTVTTPAPSLTGNRTQNKPDASGTYALEEWVASNFASPYSIYTESGDVGGDYNGQVGVDGATYDTYLEVNRDYSNSENDYVRMRAHKNSTTSEVDVNLERIKIESDSIQFIGNINIPNAVNNYNPVTKEQLDAKISGDTLGLENAAYKPVTRVVIHDMSIDTTTVALGANEYELQINGPIAKSFTGTAIPLDDYYQKDDTSTDTGTWTLGTTKNGGSVEILINLASEPSVTGATQVTGSQEFIADTLMVLTVKSFSGTVKYWFTEL